MAKQQRNFKTSKANPAKPEITKNPSGVSLQSQSNDDDNLNVEDIVLEIDSTNFVNQLISKELQAAEEDQNYAKANQSKQKNKQPLFPKTNTKTAPPKQLPALERMVTVNNMQIAGLGINKEAIYDLQNRGYDTGDIIQTRRNHPYHAAKNRSDALYTTYQGDTIHKFTYDSKFFKLPILQMNQDEEELSAKTEQSKAPTGRGKRGKRVQKAPVSTPNEPPQPLIKEWFSKLSV